MGKDVWPFLSLSFAVIDGRHPAVEGETQRHPPPRGDFNKNNNNDRNNNNHFNTKPVPQIALTLQPKHITLQSV